MEYADCDSILISSKARRVPGDSSICTCGQPSVVQLVVRSHDSHMTLPLLRPGHCGWHDPCVLSRAVQTSVGREGTATLLGLIPFQPRRLGMRLYFRLTIIYLLFSGHAYEGISVRVSALKHASK